MATATKHRQRSHRSYEKNVDFSDFHRKAQMAKARKTEKSIFGKIFHRTTNK